MSSDRKYDNKIKKDSITESSELDGVVKRCNFFQFQLFKVQYL